MNTLPIVLDGSKFEWSNGRRLRGVLPDGRYCALSLAAG